MHTFQVLSHVFVFFFGDWFCSIISYCWFTIPDLIGHVTTLFKIVPGGLEPPSMDPKSIMIASYTKELGFIISYFQEKYG